MIASGFLIFSVDYFSTFSSDASFLSTAFTLPSTPPRGTRAGVELSYESQSAPLDGYGMT